MNINPVNLPVIVEQPASYATSSQNARIEGSWHRSDLAQSHIDAQRLQEKIKASQIPKTSIESKSKTVCYKLALGCGMLAFPAIACAFFIKNGWTIPAGLATSCILLFFISGKRTQDIKNLSKDLKNNSQECEV